MTHRSYVVGFLFDQPCDRVLLIEKRHPVWQAGMLNGVGGKAGPGESIAEAMRRESLEEADVTPDWRHFVTLRHPVVEVAFFVARDSECFHQARALTDERLARVPIARLGLWGIIADLAYLIPMARHSVLFETIGPAVISVGDHAAALASRGADDVLQGAQP